MSEEAAGHGTGPQPPERSGPAAEHWFEPIYAGLKASSVDPDAPSELDPGAPPESEADPAGVVSADSPPASLEEVPPAAASLRGLCGVVALLVFLIALGSFVFLVFGE